MGITLSFHLQIVSVAGLVTFIAVTGCARARRGSLLGRPWRDPRRAERRITDPEPRRVPRGKGLSPPGVLHISSAPLDIPIMLDIVSSIEAREGTHNDQYCYR